MDKEIKPAVALLIVLIFITPIIVRFWAGGEHALARAGVYFLQEDAHNQLSLQADRLLVTIPNNGDNEGVFDFSPFMTEPGTADLMGNIAYFANNDVLIRIGSTQYGPSSYLSLASSSDPDAERLRQSLSKNSGAPAQLLRCDLKSKRCQSFHNIQAPWRYRLYINTDHDEVYLSEGTTHKARAISAAGQPLGDIDQGLLFPKRIRPYQEGLYLVDTNHRSLHFLNKGSHFSDTGRELKFNADTDKQRQWLVDAVYFADHWWIILASNGMSNTALYRADHEGKILNKISLAAKAEPFDLLVRHNHLLVSDLHSGAVYRLNQQGELIDTIRSPAIHKYFTELAASRAYYQNIITLSHIALGLLAICGISGAIVTARRHRQANPKMGYDPTALPSYLNPLLPLYRPSTTLEPAHQLKERSMSNILISNIEIIPGKRVTQHLGLVMGSTVRAKHAGKDFMAGLKNIFGGELGGYTELLSEARQEATERMTEQAKAIGGNAVINVRYSTSSITAGASEILAYGTAVFLEDK